MEDNDKDDGFLLLAAAIVGFLGMGVTAVMIYGVIKLSQVGAP